MYVAPLESYGSGLFSASIVSPFGMIISIKDPLILKDLIQIVYISGSHGLPSPKISWKYIKESDMAGALKLWYRGGLGSIWFSHLQHVISQSHAATASLKEALAVCQLLLLAWYLIHDFWILEAPGLIHFTFDAWTSTTMHEFLGITCHFRDNDWKTHSNLMSFCKLDGPHTGENIGKMLLAEIGKMIPLTKVSLNYLLQHCKL